MRIVATRAWSEKRASFGSYFLPLKEDKLTAFVVVPGGRIIFICWCFVIHFIHVLKSHTEKRKFCVCIKLLENGRKV